MNFSIPNSDRDSILNELGTANLKFQETYPGDKPDRQAVHTVYGGANLFRSDTCLRMGEVALKSLQTYAPNFVVLANVLQLDGFRHLPSSEKEILELTDRMNRMSESDRKREKA